jgi:hypothetical protein
VPVSRDRDFAAVSRGAASHDRPGGARLPVGRLFGSWGAGFPLAAS